MPTSLSTSFGYITLNGQQITVSGGNRLQIGLSNVTMLISDSGAFVPYNVFSGYTGTPTTGNFATIGALYQTGSILYNDIISLSGQVVSAIQQSGSTTYNYITGLSGSLNLVIQQTGSNLYNYIVGLSGEANNALIQTGQQLISLIHASNAGVSTLNGLSGTLNLISSGYITFQTGIGGITLGLTGIPQFSDLNALSGIVNSSFAVFPFYTGNFSLASPVYRYLWSGTNGSSYTGTLPSVSSSSGIQYVIKNISTGAILTIIGTIDYSSNYSLYGTSSIDLISNGTSWLIC